jgi:hypothetical protein
VIAGTRSLESLPFWLISGAIVGIFLLATYWAVIRYSLPVVLIASGVVQLLAAARRGVTDRVPASMPGIVLGILAATAGVWWWYRRFSRKESESSIVQLPGNLQGLSTEPK